MSSRKDNKTEVAEFYYTQQAVHESVAQGLTDVVALLSDPNDDGEQKTNKNRSSGNTPPDQILSEQVLDRRESISEELRHGEDLTLAGSRINIDDTRAGQPRLTETEQNPLPVTKA